MDARAAQAEILCLLDDSPVTSTDIGKDIRQSVAAGEAALAFDTLCSWIYEDSLTISRTYHRRLAHLADELDMQKWIGRLEELVEET